MRQQISIQAIALIIGISAYYIQILRTFMYVPITMPLHELGHAVAAWLSGMPAVPVYFFTAISENQSPYFSLFVSTILIVGLFVSYKKKNLDLFVLINLLLIAHIILSYCSSDGTRKQVISAAGFMGEALFAPFFVLLSFQNLGWWWKMYRFLFSCAATLSLGLTLAFWTNVIAGLDKIPLGSLLFGSSHGDINTLIDSYSWTEIGLTRLFFGVTLIALLTTVSYLTTKISFK